MKSRIKHNVLALAPCAKRLGITVFSQKEMIYFAVKTLKTTETSSVENEISRIVQKLVREFAPEKVVIKQLNKQQAQSANVQLISRRIISQIEAVRIFWQEISFEIAKKHLCPDKKATSINAFKTLSIIYPELCRFVNHPSLWQTEYYNSLLSAATVGFYSLERNSR